MTYYGRLTYKFEEAARRGAITALVIHETAAVGYDWKVASSTIVGWYDIVRSGAEAQPGFDAGVARSRERCHAIHEAGARLRGA
jgi:hypothetical protein